MEDGTFHQILVLEDWKYYWLIKQTFAKIKLHMKQGLITTLSSLKHSIN